MSRHGPRAGTARDGLMRRALFAGLALVLLAGLAIPILAAFDIGGILELFAGDGGTMDPPGNPRAFDPVARYAAVAAYAGAGASLVRMEAVQVRSDGLLDLEAPYQPAPRVHYAFVRTVPLPANAPPLGAGAPADGRWRQRIEVDLGPPGAMHYVRKVGKGGIEERPYVSRGMQRREREPTVASADAVVAPPSCALRGLWRQAIARGVPADAIAEIDYGRDGYDFTIRGTRWSLRFAPDCALQTAG